MLHNPPREKEDALVVDGVPVNFTPEHKMVSTRTFDALFLHALRRFPLQRQYFY